jgi:hypothetical protein
MDVLSRIRAIGVSYDEYIRNLEHYIAAADPESLNSSGQEKMQYAKLNWHRITRLNKIFCPSEDICSLIKKINTPQEWLILTAMSCGDSAQNIPIIIKFAQINSLIIYYLVERDDHLDIMDLYLTEGKRSIPKIIAFTKNGDEIFRWGSRPRSAQALVTEHIAEGTEKHIWEAKLHLWYAQNKGKEIENEFMEIFKQTAR